MKISAEMKKYLASVVPQRLRIRLRLRKEIANRDILLVHTMGKVGSSSVYHSLQGIGCPIYHTHFLSEGGLGEAEGYFKSHDAPVPYHIGFSRQLKKHLLLAKRIRVICLVRDPIARSISGYFQIGDRTSHEIHSDVPLKKRDPDRVIAELRRQIISLKNPDNYVESWMDREVKGVFGIDVFSRPFDTLKGYATFQNGKVSLTVLRVEDLDRVFNAAAQDLLDCSRGFHLERHNSSADKENKDLWCNVVESLRLPKRDCEEIFSGRSCSHFYGDMKDKLMTRWCSEE